MTDRLKDVLDRAVSGPAPESGIDIDAAVERGDTVRRRRRLFAAGGATAALVVGLAITLVVTSSTSGPAVPAGPLPGDDSIYQLPEPESDMLYELSVQFTGGEMTEETRKYTEAFWGYLDENYPDLEDLNDESGNGERFPRILRGKAALLSWDADDLAELRNPSGGDGEPEPQDTGYEETIYYLDSSDPQTQSGHASAQIKLDPEQPYNEAFHVTVYPQGGFTPGIGGEYELGVLARCDDWAGDGYTHTFDCAETTTAQGESAITIAESTRGADGRLVEIDQRVVLFADNGTAVELNDNPVGTVAYDEYGDIDLDNVEPYLDFPDLLDFATAIAHSGGVVR